MKTFINAKIVLIDRVIGNGFVCVSEGKIVDFGAGMIQAGHAGEIIDCGGRYLSPGFIDTHSHGGGGHDFMDGDEQGFVKACRTHLRHGTTTLLPTTLTSSDEDLFISIDNFKSVRRSVRNMPNLPGLHLEGPYFCSSQKGAQPEQYIRNPEPKHYNKIMDYANGTVVRWSVAPELPGALDMARSLSSQGVVMSMAHTDADYSQIVEAVESGFSHLTHFYSGMSTIVRRGGFRILGAIECGYLMDELTVEIIADGMHLPPELLRLIVKCKNNDSISLVTDSMRGAGMPDGPSVLGSLKNGQQVIVEDGIAKMPDRSCFAGSVATTDRLVRVMVSQAGLTVEAAVMMMALNPAKLIGLDAEKGSIAIGKDADLIVFDDRIDVSGVYIKGKEVVF